MAQPSGTPRRNDARKALIAHVVKVQREVRTCNACGLCCTAAHNSVRILTSEAQRIAAHLAELAPARRELFTGRMQKSVTDFHLKGERKANYTCPFLETDMSCALPMTVKPVACLSFNPRDLDHCDQEPEWYARAHALEELETREAGADTALRPIPVAVLRLSDEAARRRTPRRRR